MRPSPIQPSKPVLPVKRRWHAPEHTHDEQDAPRQPTEAPATSKDSDDDHIDEYAR